jgi:hypothetical protein
MKLQVFTSTQKSSYKTLNFLVVIATCFTKEMVVIVLEPALETWPFHLSMCQANRVQSYSINY